MISYTTVFSSTGKRTCTASGGSENTEVPREEQEKDKNKEKEEIQVNRL